MPAKDIVFIGLDGSRKLAQPKQEASKAAAKATRASSPAKAPCETPAAPRHTSPAPAPQRRAQAHTGRSAVDPVLGW